MNLPPVKKPFFFTLLFFVLLLPILPNFLWAFDSKDIEKIAYQYLKEHENEYKTDSAERVEFILSHLDHRLKLENCPTQPIVQPQESLYHSNRFTLRIICQGGNSWIQYIAVQVKRWSTIVISKMPIAKQTVLDGSMIDMKETNLAQISGSYFQNSMDVIGKVAKQPIGAHQAILNHHLELAVLIRKNQTVMIVAGSGTIKVKTGGIALENGKKGQRIKVKNSKSQRVIEATILDANTVTAH